MNRESHKRTIAKTLSWRIIATFITASLAYFITGDAKVGITVGVADTMVKLVCYYLHERTWSRIGAGYKRG